MGAELVQHVCYLIPSTVCAHRGKRRESVCREVRTRTTSLVITTPFSILCVEWNANSHLPSFSAESSIPCGRSNEHWGGGGGGAHLRQLLETRYQKRIGGGWGVDKDRASYSDSSDEYNIWKEAEKREKSNLEFRMSSLDNRIQWSNALVHLKLINFKQLHLIK